MPLFSRGGGGSSSSNSGDAIIIKTTTTAERQQYEIPSTKQRFFGCNWSMACTLFFRILQIGNSIVICLLVVLVLAEYKRIETLEAMLPELNQEIAGLQTEVQTKQQTQIQKLDNEIQEEHDLTFLTLAGIFTLLTCLISMFHMSSHLQRMNQPIIQRKIVAILWMSPIYGVTSFLSLVYPPMDGYLAILKDFYESYCIYTFLSFLIAVLGKGSRDAAAEVLAKHADHMEQPTRLLSMCYDPPPDSSPVAKASAIITECQIMAMQFVFIRPLTTVIYVIYKHMHKADGSNAIVDASNASAIVDDDVFMTTPPSWNSYDDAGNDIDDTTATNNGTRWLQDDMQGADTLFHNDNFSLYDTLVPTVAPTIQDILDSIDTINPDDEFATDAPFLGNNETGITQDQQQDFGAATKAYFTSFGFVLTMIVNVSVFFAFAGLLKFYHVVHEDLKWCRPWPKFLTIKGVVFLTFWQGLMILIIVHLNSDSDNPSEQARRYQNILICMEMLLFSLTHWCVFPAEEWQKDYEPPEKINKPGIGIQDFVSDVGYIVKSGRQQRRNRRRGRRGLGGSRSDHSRVIYHKPTADLALTNISGDEDTATTSTIPSSIGLDRISASTKPVTVARQRSFSEGLLDGDIGGGLPRQRSFSESFTLGDEDDDDDDDDDNDDSGSSDDLSLL